MLEIPGTHTLATTLEQELPGATVLLIGSRATGEAERDSDWDLLACVATRNLPSLMRRLRRVEARLARELGAPVAVNPLPSFRLRRPGRTLLVWKALYEGRVVAGRQSLRAAGTPNVTTDAIASYALSGLRYLLDAVDDGDAAGERAFRKALRHEAQLRLLETGAYASSLERALELLPHEDRAQLERLLHTEQGEARWDELRDLLAQRVAVPPLRGARALAHNLQYVALSALRRRGLPLWALFGEPVGQQLGAAVVALAARGPKDAAALLPRRLRPTEITWTTVRGTIDREWPQANPLLGI